MFKVNDKLVLNAFGSRQYKGHVIAKKGCYATVINAPLSDTTIIKVRWYNAKRQKIHGWQCLNFWSKNFQLFKSRKPYNHPLTPIFAKKMPHFGPPKIKKKRLDKKIFS
jgi:hypothetical protein